MIKFSSLLPVNIGKTQVFQVANEAERLALTGVNPGDECVQADTGRWYIMGAVGHDGDAAWILRPHYNTDEVYNKSETMTAAEIAALVASTEVGKIYVVADAAERLALSQAQNGDEVFQSDADVWYVLYGSDPSKEADWLARPTGIDGDPVEFRRELDVYSKGEVDAAIFAAAHATVKLSGGGTLEAAKDYVVTDGGTYNLPLGADETAGTKLTVRLPFAYQHLQPTIAAGGAENINAGNGGQDASLLLDAGQTDLVFFAAAAGWDI